MKKKISCILPVKGHKNFLSASIESILRQSYKNFELIILDNGNKQDVKKIINYYKKKDNRIKTVKLKNLNLSELINYGIKISKGYFIARQDSDDISHLDRFYHQVNWFNKKNKILCGTNSFIIDSSGKIKGKINNPENHTKILNQMNFRNPFIHSSVMFRKSILKGTNKYDKYFKYSQDFDLWTKLCNIGITGNLKKRLHFLRSHGDTISLKKKEQQRKYFVLSAAKYIIKKRLKRNITFSKKIDLEIKNLELKFGQIHEIDLLKFLYILEPLDKSFIRLKDLSFTTLIKKLHNFFVLKTTFTNISKRLLNSIL